MPFGQQPGPPATGRQMQQLTALVVAAGHTDLRDARGPLGLSQRQAGGRFTRDEADALIGRLEGEADGAPAASPPDSPSQRFDRRDADRSKALRRMPAELLAAELQRRGWAVIEP